MHENEPEEHYIAEGKDAPATTVEYSDAELVGRIERGDRTAFADLIDRHKESIKRSFARNVGDFHVVEDLFQETCLRAFQALRERVQPDNVEAWLHGIARNCRLEWYRRRKMVPPENDEPEAILSVDPLQETERREVVKKSLSALSEDARTVLLMRHHREMTFEEIARTMDKPIGTVMSLACRAYKQLRGELSIYAGKD